MIRLQFDKAINEIKFEKLFKQTMSGIEMCFTLCLLTGNMRSLKFMLSIERQLCYPSNKF